MTSGVDGPAASAVKELPGNVTTGESRFPAGTAETH
jgi:hypothetical protein